MGNPYKSIGPLAKFARNQGSALLSALFIMTLVAIVATAMSMRVQLDIYQTRLMMMSDRLYLASQAVTFWAMDLLSLKKNDFVVKPPKVANFPKSMAKRYLGIITTGGLYDLQAYFNLNNLRNHRLQPLYLRLLKNNLSFKEEPKLPLIIEATEQWINPYRPGRGQDKILNTYLQQTPPYLPAYQALSSPSELRLIAGIDANIYQRILPLITTLPEITPINLKTASPKLLMILGNGLNKSEVDTLIEALDETEHLTIEKLNPLLHKLHIPTEQITLESQYYLSIAKTTGDDLSLTRYTVLKRSKDRRGIISVSIVSESLNTL